MQLAIDYQVITAEDLAARGAKFDVIYASEVIEHVADRPLFITAIAAMLAPDGVVVITTINRSLPALVFAKFALEYIVRLVPYTHLTLPLIVRGLVPSHPRRRNIHMYTPD